MYIGLMTMIRILVVVILVVLFAFLGLTYKRWEGQPPQIAFDRDFKSLGKSPPLGLTVKDEGTGLKQVTIRLKQKDTDVVLADETLPASEKTKTYDIGKLMAEKGTQEGPASLSVN